MTGPKSAGWYRAAGDAPDTIRRVSGSQGSFVTCLFDMRSGYPCSNGYRLSDEDWNGLVPVPDPQFPPL